VQIPAFCDVFAGSYLIQYEGVSKRFRTGCLERELYMVELSLYRYFVSQSSEFRRHNSLCCFSTSNTKGKRTFLYRLSPETSGYTLVQPVTLSGNVNMSDVCTFSARSEGNLCQSICLQVPYPKLLHGFRRNLVLKARNRYQMNFTLVLTDSLSPVLF
jgi:hypothetical protein